MKNNTSLKFRFNQWAPAQNEIARFVNGAELNGFYGGTVQVPAGASAQAWVPNCASSKYRAGESIQLNDVFSKLNTLGSSEYGQVALWRDTPAEVHYRFDDLQSVEGVRIAVEVIVAVCVDSEWDASRLMSSYGNSHDVLTTDMVERDTRRIVRAYVSGYFLAQSVRSMPSPKQVTEDVERLIREPLNKRLRQDGLSLETVHLASAEAVRDARFFTPKKSAWLAPARPKPPIGSVPVDTLYTDREWRDLEERRRRGAIAPLPRFRNLAAWVARTVLLLALCGTIWFGFIAWLMSSCEERWICKKLNVCNPLCVIPMCEPPPPPPPPPPIATVHGNPPGGVVIPIPGSDAIAKLEPEVEVPGPRGERYGVRAVVLSDRHHWPLGGHKRVLFNNGELSLDEFQKKHLESPGLQARASGAYALIAIGAASQEGEVLTQEGLAEARANELVNLLHQSLLGGSSAKLHAASVGKAMSTDAVSEAGQSLWDKTANQRKLVLVMVRCIPGSACDKVSQSSRESKALIQAALNSALTEPKFEFPFRCGRDKYSSFRCGEGLALLP